MPTIQKAGAIILAERDPSKIVLIYRSRQDDWSFPKGHMEDGESAVEAALREVTEETGLSVRLVGVELPPMEYDYPAGGHVVVHMFLVRSRDDSTLRACS